MTTGSEIRSPADAPVDTPPTEFTTRPYQASDATSVAELLNEREVSFGGDPYFTDTEIRDMTSSWVRTIDTDTRLVFAPDGLLVGMAMVAPPEDGGSIGDTFGGVRLGFLGRGIGRALLSWQIERLGELRGDRAPDAAWTVDVGANLRDESAARLFERFGMAPVRYFFEMLLPIADLRPAAMPDGFRVVPFTGDLIESLYEADDEAFSEHWGHERRAFERWRAGAIDSDLFRPEHTRIALDGDAIAAYVLAYDDGIGSHYIGKVGTRRPWRRRGLAAALMSQTIEAAGSDGKTLASLGVDSENATGALGVYERLGFAARQRFVIYRKALG